MERAGTPPLKFRGACAAEAHGVKTVRTWILFVVRKLENADKRRRAVNAG